MKIHAFQKAMAQVHRRLGLPNTPIRPKAAPMSKTMTKRVTDKRLQDLCDQYGRRECLSPKGEPHVELDDIASALQELIDLRAALAATVETRA